MAVVYPAANDNWSTVANWMSGGNPYGQLPQSGDIVCANGKTIVIDMDLAAYTFDHLTTVATSPAAAGGGFTVGINCTINANITAGTTSCLTSTGIGTTLVINGEIKGGGGSYAYGIYCTAACNVTITGNVTGGSGSQAYGIYCTAACNVTITGNVTGGIGYGSHGIYCTGTCNVTITGNVTGGSGGLAYGIVCTVQCIVNITGNVTGGSGGLAYGIYCTTQTSYVTIRGIITTQTPPIAQSQALNGTIVLYFAGIIISKTGMMPFNVQQFILLSSGSTMWTVKTELNTDKNIYTADYAPLGNPATTDVRSGVIFGPSGELEGELIVAPKASVAKNVPTDDGVGTMEMLPSDFWAYANRTLTDGNLTAQEVWEYVNRTITSGGITAAEIWGYLFTSVLPDDSFGKLFKDYLNAKVGDIPSAVINELTSSMEDVAVRIRNLATTEIVGDIHAT